MGTLQQFEEIEAWQKARELTRAIYECSKSGEFERDYGLRDQMRRAAVSSMSNIVEGFERRGKGEFLQFLSIARGSAAEVASHLYVALDQGYLSEAQFKELHELTRSTINLVNGFISYLRSSPFQGEKYKIGKPLCRKSPDSEP
ncbi:four helix bundle protein [Candidatus Poribacteria bacterium]|nr:four helix bundle protein [Candidatus Poribacteria bacterium]